MEHLWILCAAVVFVALAVFIRTLRSNKISVGDYCFVYDHNEELCQARITHIIYDDEHDTWLYRVEYIDSSLSHQANYLPRFYLYFQ